MSCVWRRDHHKNRGDSLILKMDTNTAANILLEIWCSHVQTQRVGADQKAGREEPLRRSCGNGIVDITVPTSPFLEAPSISRELHYLLYRINDGDL